MTRRKKTRKIGQIGVRKQESRPSDSKEPRKKKSPKGQRSGARNSLIVEPKSNTSKVAGDKKDPKLGSKKKIELVKQKVVEKKIVAKANHLPNVQLKKVDTPALPPEQELKQLESDSRLIELAERVESGELLTGKDAKYFNQKMERHEQLLEILGIEDEQDEEGFSELGGDEWQDFLSEDDK